MTHDGSAEIRWFCCQSVKPFFYYLLFVWMRTQFESGSEIFTVSYILYNVQCCGAGPFFTRSDNAAAASKSRFSITVIITNF